MITCATETKQIQRKISTGEKMSSSNNIDKKNGEEKHVCRLPPPEDILATYICEGWFVPLRRQIKKLFMANEKSSYTRECLRSSFLIRKENKRHLTYYYHMIHPFSKGRALWEIIIIIILCVSIFLMPFVRMRFVRALDSCNIIITSFLIADVVRTFYTGRYRENFNDTILNPRSVAIWYFKGWFWNDILASNFSNLFVNFITNPEEKKIYLIIMSFLKITQILKLFDYINNLQKSRQYSVYKFKAFRLLMLVLVLIFWLSGVSYLMVQNTPEHWFHTSGEQHGPFLGVILRVNYFFFLYGCAKPHSLHILTLSLEIITMNIGNCFNIYATVQIVQFVKQYNASANRYQQLKSDLHQYIKYKELPDVLGKRLLDYYEFRFQKHYYNEDLILKTISDQLREGIIQSACHKFFQQVELFSSLPEQIMGSVIKLMQSKLVLPQDVICQAGTAGDSMYFLITGTVAVYSKFGKEICHLYDGDHFGEIAMLSDGRRVATVVAVDSCELYILSREEFKRALQHYPEVMQRIKTLAKTRYLSATAVVEERE